MSSTSFKASYQPASGTTLVPRGSLTANLIELGPLVQLAEFLPFPADLRALIAELAPQGNLLDAKLDWTGELPDRANFTARSRFSGLTMNAWRNVPGFANISGSVQASESRGAVTFASRKSEIDLPALFPEPRIALDALSGEVAWERLAASAPGKLPGIGVRLSNLSFANEDLAGTAQGSYQWGDEGPGRADLTVQLLRADGKTTAKYLPLAGIMGENTREWGAGAIQAGQLSDVRLRLKGDLRDFPFQDPGKGQFEVSAKLSDAIFDYARGWPRMEGLEATVMLERDRFDLVGQRGSILGAKVENMRISLPGILDSAPQLLVEGSVEGPTAAFLEYIRESPARRMTGGATEAMTSLGRGRLRLRLDLALKDMAKSKVAGEYQFTSNSILLDPGFAPIERASGRIAFTEDSLTIPEIRGQMFGDQVRISGGSRPDGSVQIAAEGRATVEGMRPIFDHPWRRRLTGGARYSALLSVKDGRAQFTMDSTLEGVASSLPPPLAKNAAEPLPLRLEVFPGDGRDRLSLALGPPSGRIVSAEYLRTIPQGGTSLQVQRALVTLNPVPGETAKFPERRGLTIRGSLPALDLDRWLPLLGEAPTGQLSEPVSYDVKVGLLDALGKRMRGVSMQGAADATGWSATMTTAEFAGDLVYRHEGDGRLVARLTRLVLPEDSPGVRPGESLKDLPAVDVVAEDFTHRGRKLGRFEVLARHEGTVDERNWRIERLAMTNSDATLSGSGLWRQGISPDTALAFKLDVTDIGQLLDRLGFPNHVKSGKASLDGSLKWNGDPLNLDYATLNGQLQLHAEDGQFLEIEPGVGKLVSLMSLQMLPRRLSLDFRDVFSKGFHFDRINGNMGIERGVMAVKKFNMRGPAADISMTGQVDLSLETQSLAVRVTPQLGDVASTVVGLVNPIAGLATLIAGRMIKNPLGKMFAYGYSISGTWSDPKIEKQQAEAVPQIAEPGSPPR